mgnify:CR=1 FL=1
MPDPADKPMLDLYFMDARSKLIDIAAFMDRIERTQQCDDYRYQAFVNALNCLQSENRAESVLNAFSDHSTEPSAKASPGAATGALKKD